MNDILSLQALPIKKDENTSALMNSNASNYCNSGLSVAC